MKTQYVEFKLYLEGVEVEFVDVQLLEDVRRPPSCTITMAANSIGMDVLPCTTAHLFHKVDNEWLLVFEGEMTSKSFQKSTGQRSVALHFLGITNNLNRVFKKSETSLTMDAYYNSNFLLITPDEDKGVITFPSEAMTAVGGSAFIATMFKRAFDQIEQLFEKLPDREDGLSGGYKDEPKAGYEHAIEYAMSSIFKDAADTSPWYRQFYNSMRVNDRILSFPNKMIGTSLHAIANASLVRNVINSLPNITPLTQLIYNFLSYFGHRMLHLSAPIANNISIVFMPNSDYFAPIKSNIFFSDNVESASFTHDSMRDPTRLSVTSDALSFMETREISFTPTYYAPGPVNDYDPETGRIDLTREEQYRGIMPSTERLAGIDSVYTNLIQNAKTEQNREETGQEREELTKQAQTDKAIAYILNGGNGDTTENTARVVEKRYWDSRYRSRSFNIVAAYSPYRITGFAGVFIDDTLPAIAGQVASIQTNISSTGRAISTVIFELPRIVWDWNAEGVGFDTSDITPPLEPWFDQDVYSLWNIGPNVYNKIIGEASSEDKSSIMSYGDLDSKFSNEAPILQTARTDSTDTRYTSYHLARQIKAIKNYYFSMSENDRHRFEQTSIKRKLSEEEEYWSWLLHQHLDEKLNSASPYIPTNVRTKSIYRDIDVEDDQISIFSDDEDFDRLAKKPFIKQRKDAIERL